MLATPGPCRRRAEPLMAALHPTTWPVNGCASPEVRLVPIDHDGTSERVVAP